MAGKFVRLVPTDGIAYHSTFFQHKKDQITSVIAAAIAKTGVTTGDDLTTEDGSKRERSTRWLSTSGQDNHRLVGFRVTS